MSDTPRTDAFEALVNRPTNWWDFARELERENKQLRQTVMETLNQRGQRELIVAWDRVKELERENAALVADKERLDSGTILLTVNGKRVHHVGVNLRDAIDAARKEKP